MASMMPGLQRRPMSSVDERKRRHASSSMCMRSGSEIFTYLE
jgi:hypothetical protein